jgi:nuclear transport factor 2 (NTF2) superfamily protein
MADATITTRPPLPPFTRESAIQKVRLAEDGWNTRDPERVALSYTIDVVGIGEGHRDGPVHTIEEIL